MNTPEFGVIAPSAASQLVVVNGLEYVFDGYRPDQPKTLHWRLTPAEDVEVDPTRLSITHRTAYVSGKREVSKIAGLLIAFPKDEDYHLASVESRTWIYDRGSKYFGARGVGSFMLGKLCEMADERKVSVSLEAFSMGRLGQRELEEWYQRNGFVPMFPSTTKRRDAERSLSMVREPR